MKLTGILLLIAFLHVSAGGLAQKVTLSVKDAPLSTIFDQIKQQTGLSFLWDEQILKTSKPVSIKVRNIPVADVLEEILKEQGLTYSIIQNMIVIKSLRSRKIDTSILTSPPVDIRGHVTDSLGNPLAGASVIVKGSNKGTMTNAKGNFILKGVDDSQTIVISFTGYVKKEFKVNASNDYEVFLEKSNNQLDQVVVIPYGTTTQRLNTGDVATVTAKTIEQQPVSNVLAALEGRVAGLVITQSTGVPGGGFTVQIRGQNSILNGNNPFFVVDGVPYDSQMPGYLLNGSLYGGNPLNFINPYDIESVEVLKDADATSIYGSRAANGAILITTKKGKAGVTKVDVNAYSGIGQVTRDLKLLNTPQYLSMRHEAFNNDGQLPDPTRDFDLTFWDTTRYTNWQKVLTGNTAHYTDAQASISGGSANTQYLVGAGYHRETTVFPALLSGDGVDQKGSVHFNINSTSPDKKLKFIFSGSYLVDKNTVQSEDFSVDRITLSPDAPPIYNSDGSLNWAPLNPGESGTWTNPFSYLMVKYKGTTSNLISNAVIDYTLIPGLDIKANLGYNNLQTNEVQATPTTAYDPGYDITSGSSRFNTMNSNSWIIEPQVNYYLKLGQGSLKVLVGSSFLENNTSVQSLNARNFASNALLEDIQAAGNISASTSSSSQYKYEAVFGRLSYDWQEKYLLNFTARRDGSSRFGPGKQFANFGAVGIGWIFTKENFFQKNLPLISFGKIRASYGTTGNDQIGDYRFLDLYNSTSNPYQGTQGLYPANLFNPDLAWEINKKFETGLELGFLKERIVIQASYFLNRSSSQLVNTPVAAITGFSSIASNLPALVQNSGGEFVINTVNIRTKNFSWNSSLNLTIARNKLISFPNLSNSPYNSYFIIGQPLTIHRLYQFAGVNDTTGVYQFASGKGGNTYQPSFPNDLLSVVNTAPEYYGGLQNSFQFKGFSLDFFFQFVKQIGQNIHGSYTIMPGTMFNQPTGVLNEWRNSGDNKPIQQFSQNYSSNAYQSLSYASQSNFIYSDASFIRLKNLSISWQIPDSWKQKMHLQSCRIYVQGQNLLTITKYNGIDPETQGTMLPPLRVLSVGFQLSL